jgi:hypothetical protein
VHKRTWTANDTCELVLAIVAAGNTPDVHVVLSRLQAGTLSVPEATAFLQRCAPEPPASPSPNGSAASRLSDG